MFENTFKNIDDILHKDAGCSSELDYVEQTSWILFLKYLDDLELSRKLKSELEGGTYKNILEHKFSWEVWACPKTSDGKIDYNKALTGDDLKDFVNSELFPYLSRFKSSAESATTLEYKMGEIFSEIKNKIQSGYNLRDILDKVDGLKFQTSADIHEMSHLYEDKIKNMGNAGRNGGEYYTPRPLIKAIIQVVRPKIGDRIYDGAVGSAGFLCEAFNYLLESRKLSTKDIEVLQKDTFFGKEKKSLAYIIGTMNMILHGIDAPNILHTNTLSENIADIQEKDRFDVVLANPPFGGKERAEVQQNFPIRSGESAYLFLQHFMKILKAGGKAGVIIKDTFLSNPDSAAVNLRKELITNHNLHTILVCPSGTFSSTGAPTVVLFFNKGEPSTKIWYYELEPDHVLGKTSPLNENDLIDFLKKQVNKEPSSKSWIIDVENIDTSNYDLTPRNPTPKPKKTGKSLTEIITEVQGIENQTNEILENVTDILNSDSNKGNERIANRKLKDILVLNYGKGLPKSDRSNSGKYFAYGANGPKSRTDKHLYDGESIIVGRKGSAGELTRVDGKFWPLDVTYYITLKEVPLDMDYLFFALKMLNIPKLARGVKPGINREDVYKLEIPVPDIDKQLDIVQTLIKIQSLKELGDKKKSLLHELQDKLMNTIFETVNNA